MFSADLVTFDEEILKGKLHFLCSECSPLLQCVSIFYSFWYSVVENIETTGNTNTECSDNISLLHFNPFASNAPFFYPLKTSKNFYGFLMFSGGKEKLHDKQMG